MFSGIKVLGVVAALLVLAALYTGVYGAGWMGIGHHGNGHHGNSSYMNSDAVCDERNEECSLEDDSTLMSCCEADSYNHVGNGGETGACEVFNDISEDRSGCHSDDIDEGFEKGSSCH